MPRKYERWPHVDARRAASTFITMTEIFERLRDASMLTKELSRDRSEQPIDLTSSYDDFY